MVARRELQLLDGDLLPCGSPRSYSCGCGLRRPHPQESLASVAVGRAELVAKRAAGVRRRREVDVVAARARQERLKQRRGCTAHDLRQIAASVGVGDRADGCVEHDRAVRAAGALMEGETGDRDRSREPVVDVEDDVAAGEVPGSIARQIERQVAGSFRLQSCDARNDLPGVRRRWNTAVDGPGFACGNRRACRARRRRWRCPNRSCCRPRIRWPA